MVERAREYPTVREIYGSMVFDRRVMKEKLTSGVYEQVVAAMEGCQRLDAAAADVVASHYLSFLIHRKLIPYNS